MHIINVKNLTILKKRYTDTAARGPFYTHGLTLIPAWKSNHIPSKVWEEITHPFLTSTVAPLMFRMDK